MKLSDLIHRTSESDEPPDLTYEAHERHLPKFVKDEIERCLTGDEQPVFVAPSDMTLDGRYERAWLVVTSRRALSINTNHGGDPEVVSCKLANIESVEQHTYQGNATLHIRTATLGQDLLRYSLSLTDRMDEARERMESMVAEARGMDELPQSESAGQRETPQRARYGRCPQCGHPLPGWSDVCPKCLKKTALLLRLLQYVKPFWPYVVLGFALMILRTCIDMVGPYMNKILIDDVLRGRNLPLLWVVVTIILSIRIASAVISAVRGYLMSWLGQRIIIRLRTQVYQHLHRLSLSFYERKETGRLMFRVSSDTTRLQGFLTSGLQSVLLDAIMCIVIAVILFRMHPHLAAATVLPIPFIVQGSRIFGRRISRVYRIAYRKAARLTAMMAETIPGVRVVKAFAGEDREVNRFNRANDDVFEINMQARRMSSVFQPTMGFLTALGTITVWAYGGYIAIVHQQLTPGELVAFIAYLGRFYSPVRRLASMNDMLQRAATSAERVFEVLDTEPDIDDAPHCYALPEVEGRIEFEHVSFAYEPGNDVLHDVSFEIEPGEMIGLVGQSGAGKTTLINLLCRFYDVTSGAIRIDGHDLRDVTVKSLRDQIGVVLQEPFLFKGSIAENIAYGRPDCTMEEIVQSARVANAHNFILDLPDGYDTMVGERGLRLSGGQKQRISIARAILKNPRLLILDEATSSVDTETEFQIREAIDRLVQNRTTIAIAHRLSTLKSADKLIVLDHGEVVEMGTHAELLAKPDGVFARLCEMQSTMAEEFIPG